jgi:hypothetical protein
LNEIETAVRHLKVPVLDRECVESVFGIRRRRAHALMQHCGGYQAGRTWLVERSTLLQYLRQQRRDPAFAWEGQRRRQLAESLAQAKRLAQAQAVLIPVAETPASPPGLLPAGCLWEGGRLSIEFGSAEELLTRLYELSCNIAGDYESFARLVETRVAAQSGD